MAKPDGRIEKGQRLSTAISARAWNRAQDAADIVLGVRPGVTAGPLSTIRLPCVKGILGDKGYFGEVRTFADVSMSEDYYTPSMPASMSSLDNATDDEKKLLNYTFPPTIRSVTASYATYLAERAFAICIGNDSNEYALSGLAITRVRVTNGEHRRARLPIQIGHASDQQVGGCLDSAWWGPARIVGYAEPAAYSGYDDSAQFSFFDASSDPELTSISLSSPKFFWALVHF